MIARRQHHGSDQPLHPGDCESIPLGRILRNTASDSLGPFGTSESAYRRLSRTDRSTHRLLSLEKRPEKRGRLQPVDAVTKQIFQVMERQQRAISNTVAEQAKSGRPC